MGSPLPPYKHSQPRSKALLVFPVLLCLATLWQTVHLYGTCTAPSKVQNLDGLREYLLSTSQTVRRRNQVAANALQQLAAELEHGGPKVAELKKDLNESRGYLDSHKEKTLQLMVELTDLKEKVNQAQQQAQQKEDEVRQKNDELQRVQQQVKEKEEQFKKQEEQAKQKADELEKVQKQLKEKEEQLKQQPQQQTQPPQQQSAPAPSGDAVASRLIILEMAGLQCNAVKDQEFWADPMIWGYDHRSQDASECCAACNAYNAAVERGGTEKGRNSTRCNTWAFCADKEQCKERYGECWIKHQKQPLGTPPAHPPDAHATKGWISGAVYPNDTHLNQYDKHDLVLHTSLGDIQIQLLPELAPASVRELRRAARLHSQGLTNCSNCRIYRPEPGFVLQGLLEAPGSYVAVPRYPNPQQPMVMPRGMVCWAGGTGGPHFFVNMVDQSGFKDEHLCWGQVREMELVEKIINLPKRDKKPGEMNELVEHVRFNVSLKAT